MPAERLVSLARAEILRVHIQRQRLAGLLPGNFQQAAADAAKAPVLMHEDVVDIGIGRLKREEADDAGSSATQIFAPGRDRISRAT